tara:strand:+ start:4786 stop:5496 length:711 start_codon:yes stop_codon:yes gene_type:complete
MFKKKFIILGHRGAPKYFRENTIQSFKEAIKQGVDGLEIDVQKTLDGVVLIHHDDYLRDNKTKIKNSNLKKIKKIQNQKDLNHLEEIKKFLKKIKILNIEIKSSGIFNNNIEQDVIDFIKKNKIEKKTIVSSFNPLVLKKIKRIDKNIKTGYLFSRINENIFLRTKIWSYFVKPDTFHSDLITMNEKLVNWCRRKKMPILIYTVNTQEELFKAKTLKINGIFTDDPKNIFKMLKKI